MCEGVTWIHVSIFFCLCVSENLCTPLVRMDARALTFHARARTDKHAHLRTHALTHVNTHTHYRLGGCDYGRAAVLPGRRGRQEESQGTLSWAL